MIKVHQSISDSVGERVARAGRDRSEAETSRDLDILSRATPGLSEAPCAHRRPQEVGPLVRFNNLDFKAKVFDSAGGEHRSSVVYIEHDRRDSPVRRWTAQTWTWFREGQAPDSWDLSDRADSHCRTGGTFASPEEALEASLQFCLAPGNRDEAKAAPPLVSDELTSKEQPPPKTGVSFVSAPELDGERLLVHVFDHRGERWRRSEIALRPIPSTTDGEVRWKVSVTSVQGVASAAIPHPEERWVVDLSDRYGSLQEALAAVLPSCAVSIERES